MRPLISGSTVAAVMQCVRASMSAKTGVAPALTTAPAVAKKLTPGTITSSPGRTPRARRAIVSASVPLATPMQCRRPMKAANSDSKASTSGPRM